MEHFEFRYSYSQEIIGVTNGITQVELIEDSFLNPKDIEVFNAFYEDADFYNRESIVSDHKFSPIKAKALKKAKRTDFLQFSPFIRGFDIAVSEKLLAILKEFILPKYNLIPLSIKGKEFEDEIYYLINLEMIKLQDIDFRDSKFKKGNAILNNEEEVIFDNVDDYLSNIVSDFYQVLEIKLFEYPIFDIFYVQGIGNFMSNRLHEKLSQSGITGYDIYGIKIL